MTSYLSSNNHADHLSAYAQFYDTVRRIHSNSPEGCTDSTRLGEICYTRLSSSLSERRTHVHGSILCDSIQPHQLTGPTQPNPVQVKKFGPKPTQPNTNCHWLTYYHFITPSDQFPVPVRSAHKIKFNCLMQPNLS